MEYFLIVPILYWLWQPRAGETRQQVTDHPASAALGTGLVLAGVAQLLLPKFYAQTLPAGMVAGELVAAVSGWLLMAVGFALMQKATRPFATFLTFVWQAALLPNSVRLVFSSEIEASQLLVAWATGRLVLHVGWISWTLWCLLPAEVWQPQASSEEIPAGLIPHLKPSRAKIRPRRVEV